MSQLHQVLAVEGALQDTASKAASTVKLAFSKAENFVGRLKTLSMFSDDRQKENVTEHTSVPLRVDPLITQLVNATSAYWDAVWQKERSNQRACSDLIVDGVVLIHEAPATFLLGLETKLRAFRDTVDATPTLPVTSQWTEDPGQGQGIYRSTVPRETFRTEKSIKPIVLSPATDKHPAQIDKLTIDEAIGRYTETLFHSGLPPVEKAKMLERIDLLINETRKARSRANETEAETTVVANRLFSFIFDDKT